MYNLRKMTLKAKLMVLTGSAILGLVALAVLSSLTLTSLKIGGELDSALQHMDHLRSDFRSPNLNILQARILMYQIQNAKDRETIQKLAQRFQQEQVDYDQAQREAASWLKDEKLRDLITVQANRAASDYFEFTSSLLNLRLF